MKEKPGELFPKRPETVTVTEYFQTLPEDNDPKWRTDEQETASPPGEAADNTPSDFDILNNEEEELLQELLKHPTEAAENDDEDDELHEEFPNPNPKYIA